VAIFAVNAGLGNEQLIPPTSVFAPTVTVAVKAAKEQLAAVVPDAGVNPLLAQYVKLSDVAVELALGVYVKVPFAQRPGVVF
jgi:hypothetical protein